MTEKDISQPLLGKWFGRVDGEPVALDFLKDGRLAYAVVTSNRTVQIIRMVYRVEGDVIITNQPSAPKEERTRFNWHGDAVVFEFAGIASLFSREPTDWPTHPKGAS